MDSKILYYAKSHLEGSFLQEAAEKMGEKLEDLSKAVSAIVPTIFGGMSNKITNEPSFLPTIISESKNIFNNQSFHHLNGLIGENNAETNITQSSSFLFDVFGGSLHHIVEKIASFAGIKNSSTRQLFDASAIASLGSIGKNIIEEGGSSESINNFLAKNKPGFLSIIPASLGLSLLLSGAHSPMEEANNIHQQSNTFQMQKSNSFLKTLLITVIGMVIIVVLFRSCWGNEKEHDHVIGSHEQATSMIITNNSIMNTFI